MNTFDPGALVRIQVTAGTTYRIAVDGLGGETGAYALKLNPPPPNDAFSDAANRYVPTYFGWTFNASKQAGEPAHAGDSGGHSIWYRYPSRTDGLIHVDTCGSDVDTLLGVYTGAAVNALTAVPDGSNDDSIACGAGSQQSAVTFDAAPGETYYVAIDGKGGATGNVTYNLPPFNDNVDAAEEIVAAGFGQIDNATKEAGEPSHGGSPGGHSVWFRYTATRSGPLAVEDCTATFDSLLAVYTGATIGGADPLTLVGQNDDAPGCANPLASRVTFDAVAGTTYRIALDAKGASGGYATVSVPPANDIFSDPVTLSGAPASTFATTRSATKQAGEPDHGGDPGGRSVWFAWTAPIGSGSTTISTCGSELDTLLGVYTGAAVGALSSVGQSDDAPAVCGSDKTTSAVTFAATPGTTYRIAVDARGGAEGGVQVNVAPPGNDLFANRVLITGANPTITSQHAVGAAAETGEPAHAFAPAAGSVWYEWTAPVTSPATFDTCSAQFDTRLAVYTGTALGSLRPSRRTTTAVRAAPARRARALRSAPWRARRTSSRSIARRAAARDSSCWPASATTRRRSRRCPPDRPIRAPPRAPTSRSRAASRTRRSPACSTCSPRLAASARITWPAWSRARTCCGCSPRTRRATPT